MARRAGSDAEDLAADHLLRKGFTVITRRYRVRHGEIDLLAMDGDILVAIEVKSTSLLGRDPLESIDQAKKRGMAVALRAYLAEHGLSCHSRYDVVSVTPSGVRHIADAWQEIV